MMKKIKYLWNSLKYWQKSIFMGILFSIIFTRILIFFYGTFALGDWDSSSTLFLLHFIPMAVYAILFDSVIDYQSNMSFIFVTGWYVLLALLLSLIYKRLKLIKHPILCFILFLLFSILIWVINFFVLIFLLRDAY